VSNSVNLPFLKKYVSLLHRSLGTSESVIFGQSGSHVETGILMSIEVRRFLSVILPFAACALFIFGTVTIGITCTKTPRLALVLSTRSCPGNRASTGSCEDLQGHRILQPGRAAFSKLSGRCSRKSCQLSPGSQGYPVSIQQGVAQLEFFLQGIV